jgi:hypothetical protein
MTLRRFYDGQSRPKLFLILYRVELMPVVCFVWVTGVSNNLVYRVESGDFERGRWSILRLPEMAAAICRG